MSARDILAEVVRNRFLFIDDFPERVADTILADPRVHVLRATHTGVGAKPVLMYQAQCTRCGYAETDYGDYSGYDDAQTPIDEVVDYRDWFGRARERDGVLTELICPDCRSCDICGTKPASEAVDNHLLCADHEDHFDEPEPPNRQIIEVTLPSAAVPA